MNIKNNILETIGNTPLIKLNKITELTGVVFDDALYAADVLKNNTDEGGDEALQYDKVEDIQIRRRKLDA